MARRASRATPGPFSRQVIAEVHVGTFTREGSFAATARAPELRRMAALGITAIETELALALRREFPETHLLAEHSRNCTAPYDPANRLHEATWADDYRHALHVHLTGEGFGCYGDFTLQPLRSACFCSGGVGAVRSRVLHGDQLDPARWPSRHHCSGG